MRKWIPLLILVAAQFIVIIDTTILNVSVGVLVDEYRTSVTAIQAAIASYALITAILLLTGGRAAETLALRRVLIAGLAVYAAGSALTAVSSHVSLLYIGFSGLEGIGAALVLPSAVALSAATYFGSDRRIAFGVMGAMGAAAAASGPLVAGVASTYVSWRVNFAVAAVVAVGLIASAKALANPPRTARKRNFDLVGAFLSMAAVGLIVLGLVNVTRWGWWTPRQDVEVAGVAAHPLGLAPTLWVIGAGLIILSAFWWWSRRRVHHGHRPLVDPSLLHSRPVLAGAATQLFQSLVLAGVLFIIPVFLVIVVRRDPLQTAVALLPLTASLLITAFASLRIPARIAPKRRVQAGMSLMIAGTALLAWWIEDTGSDPGLGLGSALALVGIGVGLTVTQLGGVILPAAEMRIRGEASALKGTARYLGSAMGTGVIGSILIVGLTLSFIDQIRDIPAIASDEALVTEIEQAAETDLEFMSNEEMRDVLAGTDLSVAIQNAIVSVNEDARTDALRAALLAATVFGCIGFAVSFALPAHRILDRDTTGPETLPESW